jgi:SH3 domain-containing YSC84-like protein 1
MGGFRAEADGLSNKESGIMKTKASNWFLGLAVLVAVGPTRPAMAQKNPEVTVAKSLQVLSEITRNPKTGMPRLVLRKAAGIAIIPDMFKASFIFGARFGRGVLVVKQPDGTWSNPVFINLFGGSFGAQAGAQSTDLVLVFQTQKGLDRFLKGKDKLTLGVDVGAAAGPVGKRFEASTDLALKAEILSYSNTHGIFAGVSAEGGTLQIDWRANNLYYSQPVAPAAILAVNSPLAVPASTISLKQILAEKTAWPERIVRSGRPRTEGVVIEDSSPWYEEPDGIEPDREVRDEPPPGPAAARRRTPARREARPTAEPGLDDDIDFLPAGNGPKKAPKQAKPAPANDEDLPEAMPEPAAAKARPQAAKPKPKPKPDNLDDDLPDLEAPRTGTGRPGA